MESHRESDGRFSGDPNASTWVIEHCPVIWQFREPHCRVRVPECLQET